MLLRLINSFFLSVLESAKTETKRSGELQDIFEEIHRLKREIGDIFCIKLLCKIIFA